MAKESAAAKKKRLAAEQKAAEQAKKDALAEQSKVDAAKALEDAETAKQAAKLAEDEAAKKASQKDEKMKEKDIPSEGTDKFEKDALAAEGELEQQEPTANPPVVIQALIPDGNANEDEGAVLKANPENEFISPGFKIIKISVDEYIHAMNYNNGISVHEQMRKQVRFFRAMQSVFLLPSNELMDGINFIIDAFKANESNAFTKQTAFRNLDNISLSSKEIQAYTSLLWLYIKASDVGIGAVHKSIDIPVLGDSLTDKRAAEVAIAVFSKPVN